MQTAAGACTHYRRKQLQALKLQPRSMFENTQHGGTREEAPEGISPTRNTIPESPESAEEAPPSRVGEVVAGGGSPRKLPHFSSLAHPIPTPPPPLQPPPHSHCYVAGLISGSAFCMLMKNSGSREQRHIALGDLQFPTL